MNLILFFLPVKTSRKSAALVSSKDADSFWYSLLMGLRLLTSDDADVFWQLRLEALRNDPASFADSAEEHLKSTVETAERPAE